MANQWDADFVIDEEFAGKLVEEQFPELAPVNVEFISNGWDNIAYIINGKYIFRFPRRKVAIEGLDTENHVLPRIAPLLPLPITAPEFVGKPVDGYPCPFSGYPLIKGETACRMDLSEEERVKAAKPLAKFLKALHGIPRQEAERYGVKIGTWRKLDLPHRVPQVYKYLDGFEDKNILRDVDLFREMVKKTTIKPPDDRKTVVHGDFYARHVVFDDKREISGIIDWGDLCLENPAVDLSIAFNFLPPEGRKIFWETYGEIDENTLRIARFAGLTIACILLSYGYETGDEDLKREFHKGFEFLREE